MQLHEYAGIYEMVCCDIVLDVAQGAVRLTSPSISIRMTAIFYGVTKERHSVRAASRLSLNVLRFESDLCELNRL